MKKTLLILALLCAFAQGARAQNEWATVYTQTQTTASNWTALNAGSTTGRTLGSAGTTTYYNVTGNLSFTNSTAGGSGLTILGTVYLYVPSGITVTCTGANANGQTGAGAGIELTTGNSLYLIGGGTLNANGGSAANGGNGGTGGNATGSDGDWTQTGAGGTGGYGGGGAGAGIGTRGGAGGSGGSGGAGYRYDDGAEDDAQNGTNGSVGNAGSTASAMGNLYVFQTAAVTVNATGGSQGTSGGSGGQRGRGYAYDGYSYNVTVAGGGGGGAGGFGGAASNIGTGGPGGGGGGGGAGGAQDWKSSGVYDVTAPGGHGGQNANGTYAADGTEAATTGTATSQDWVTVENGGFGDNWNSASGACTFGTGGSGGARGNASTSGSASAVSVDWTTQENDWGLICFQTGSTRADWVHLTDNASTGKTLGAAGTTTYYYTAIDRTFTNSNAGGSGLTILGTVYLYIPSGKQITCTGANASGATGAGAGIELTEGNTLYLIGSGSLVATGGNAANGSNGAGGGDASTDQMHWVRSGAGGRGGNGGGGAGAGIGSRGANGGAGGAGGAAIQEEYDCSPTTGNVGSNGQNGGTAAAMGTLYIYDGSQALTPQTDIHGGGQGTTGGNGGAGGRHAIIDDAEPAWFRTMGGGGGGAGGGFGGAGSNIGTGGPGGGGGGGGASGSIDKKQATAAPPYNYGYYKVGAFGGNPGVNADGTTTAGNGANTELNDTGNMCIDYTNWYLGNVGWSDGVDHRAAGGNSGNRGSVSTSSSAHAVAVAWPTQGTGIDGNPFIISSTDDWNGFANAVTGGCTFSGQFVKIDADISVSTMAGTSDANSFQGTFDGDGHTLTFTKGTSGSPFSENYCAPFRHVKNAVIKHMHVDGTIYTSVQKAAGFVGESHGALNITNCRSSVDIHSSKSGDGTHGGFVATLSGSNNTILIDGCVFDGSFGTTNSTTNCGGFVGWGVYNKPVVSNSLMKPSSVPTDMIIYTFARWYTGDDGIYEPTITNCYYVATTNLPANQGIQAVTDAEILPVGEPVVTYNTSGITVYVNGISHGGNFYYLPDRNIKITANKWYAISTPMHDDGEFYESIANVTNLTGTAYDLLRYNESSSTWENQKAGSGATGFTTLTPGRGYIYRCSSARTLTYTGEPNSAESYSVSLTRSNNDSPLRGFNLVGNPYPFRVALMRDFYALNADGTWTEHTSGDSLEVGQGALVYTSTNNETLTFYAATRSTSAPLVATALPPLPKGLCLGEDCGEDEPDADEDVRAPRFARWDGDQLVITGEGTLTAYDVMGRMLFSVWANNDSPLRLSQFPSAGVYLLRLNGKTQKIVIR